MNETILYLLNDEVRRKLKEEYGIECNPCIFKPKLNMELMNTSYFTSRKEHRVKKKYGNSN